MGNVAFNPMCALTGATLGDRAEPADARGGGGDDGGGGRDRARSAASRRSTSSGGSTGAERVGDHKTSMLQDLEAGKPLELDALVTAVVELADLTGSHRRRT